ncbi:unnamed protein product [Cuscuta europaea]|uniref:Uncharacterized protein n=1 Tax=Cuscuta europaea TaxID=41803 RepID=A0A9P1ECH1_CUSEU|nr:unnamed protein product [Cuscuta europaea]
MLCTQVHPESATGPVERSGHIPEMADQKSRNRKPHPPELTKRFTNPTRNFKNAKTNEIPEAVYSYSSLTSKLLDPGLANQHLTPDSRLRQKHCLLNEKFSQQVEKMDNQVGSNTLTRGPPCQPAERELLEHRDLGFMMEATYRAIQPRDPDFKQKIPFPGLGNERDHDGC